MAGRQCRSLVVGFLAGVSLGLLCSATAGAQAWLPPKGEAWLSLGYGNVFVTKHYLGTRDNPGDNVENDFGHIRGQSVGMVLGYGLTDRLALSVGIPFMVTKYDGTAPHNSRHTVPQQFIDDGLYHGTFQDYTINLRYQAYNGWMAIAPFASAVIPSHSYTTFAHAAPGRGLHEYQLGFSLGGRLDRLLPGSYVEATYGYAFVERVLDIYHNRSDFALEVGYFLTPSLSVRGIGTGHYTHGGYDLKCGNPGGAPCIPDAYRPYHDLIVRTSAINLGGGLSYVLTGSTEIYASYLRTVQGRGGHKIDQALSFGVGWSFSPSQLVRRYFPSRSAGSSAEAP